MKQGKSEKTIIEQCVREGRELPKAIKNAPVLLRGLELFLVAFHRLDTCRTASFGGIGSISWMTIMEYCDRIGITDQSQRDDMEYHINELDSAYREWAEAKRKSK
ncbi:phage tail assembly chaperone [Nitrosomonas ureae]|uniref:phage tail assembly chaperone n=1 Tax=Nitrosomonas ureae TaxID=44577 RepID=UPI000BE3C528|nr:hypothetical protein [Nitrosomonas ureae]